MINYVRISFEAPVTKRVNGHDEIRWESRAGCYMESEWAGILITALHHGARNPIIENIPPSDIKPSPWVMEY